MRLEPPRLARIFAVTVSTAERIAEPVEDRPQGRLAKEAPQQQIGRLINDAYALRG